MNDLAAEFARVQRDGYLGDPNGEDAYGYLRWSSEPQGEGSTFARQMDSVHKCALRDGLRISYGNLYFDDGYSGFQYENRPAFMRMLHEIETKPRAFSVIFENIDRMSRNATAHQGYILEEKFGKFGVEPHFFDHPGGDIERVVMGLLAQMGMQKDIARMAEGVRIKARQGKVTSSKPRYGYRITDRKDSHYVLDPDKASIVKWLFEQVIYHGKTATFLAKDLNRRQIPTPQGGKAWDSSTVCRIINCPVYKGEFYANQKVMVKTDKVAKSGKQSVKYVTRPQDEWIKVDVPAIVSPEQWQHAQEAITKNSNWHMRNGMMRGWLLQGMCKCAACDGKKTLVAQISNKPHWSQPLRYYCCSSRTSVMHTSLKTRCLSKSVRADHLEPKVWSKVEAVLYDPDIIIDHLNSQGIEARMKELQSQENYYKDQLLGLEKERKKDEDAYHEDAITVKEYKVKMDGIRERVKVQESNLAEVQGKMAEQVSIEEQKKTVISALRRLKAAVDQAKAEGRTPDEVPFSLKRSLLAKMVEEILVDTKARTFTLKGILKGTYAIDDETGVPLLSTALRPGKPSPDVRFTLLGSWA